MRKTSFTHITVDGQSYASVDEMPAAVRRKYESTIGRLLADRDGDGVPDVFESGSVDGADVVHVATTSTEVYDVNGQCFTSLDQMPPELRRLVDGLRPVGHPTPHDASVPVPYGTHTTFEPITSSSRGLHIHLSWSTFAWIVSGLALAAWIGYELWKG